MSHLYVSLQDWLKHQLVIASSAAYCTAHPDVPLHTDLASVATQGDLVAGDALLHLVHTWGDRSPTWCGMEMGQGRRDGRTRNLRLYTKEDERVLHRANEMCSDCLRRYRRHYRLA